MRRRGGDHVEERALDEVAVARQSLGEQQPPAEHDRRDRRAGLGVGAIRRQFEVVAERLVLVVRALAAGHVGAARDSVLPLSCEGGEQLVVSPLDGDVDGTGREVVGAHGVAAQDVGLAHRHVVLVVGAAVLDVGERAAAAALDEERGLPPVAVVARDARQLDEGGLDLGVAAEGLVAVLAEHLADEVGGATGHLEQSVVGTRPGACPRDGGLEEVPEAVELVPPLQVGPARRLPGPSEGRVQIAVRLLGRGDPRDDRAEPLLERGVGIGPADPSELPGHGLQVLVDLGVRELPAASTLGQPSGRRQVEVAEPALPLEPARDVRESRRAVDSLAIRPEPARDRTSSRPSGRRVPREGATGVVGA